MGVLGAGWVDGNTFHASDIDAIIAQVNSVGYSSTATSAGTTTLTSSSNQVQVFTGTTTQTVKLPTTGIPAGNPWYIFNQSTGAVTVQSSNASTVVNLTGGTSGFFWATTATPVAATDWFYQNNNITGAPSVYTTTIGNNSSTSFTITHNLGTRNVTVTIYDTSTFEAVRVPPILTDTNNLSLTFATAPTTGQFAVVVMGGALLSNPAVYTTTIGNGSSTSFTLTHNLGTRSTTVVTYDATTFKRIWCDVVYTSTNSTTLAFQTAPATNGVVAVIQGGILNSSATASTNITDATTIGRNLLTATNAASALALLTPLQNAADATVATSEACTSTSYVDLTTTTDKVTLTPGASGKAIVIIRTQVSYVSGTSNFPMLAFAMSGGNTQIASDARCAISNTGFGLNAVFFLPGLSAVSTDFKLKYRLSAAGSWNFSDRQIAVIPL